MIHGSRLTLALVLGLASAGSAAGLVSAASEPPGTSESPIQFWLDKPIPPDAAVGASVEIGFTLWDPSRSEIPPIDGLYLRLHPARGKAKPSTVTTRTDWPGHLSGVVSVPEGGAGTVEAGFTGQECTEDGKTCTQVDLPFAFGGIGPPPEASRADLVEAEVHLDPGDPVAGQPFSVVVEMSPRTDWDPDDLEMPDRLLTIITRTRGQEVAKFEIRRGPDPESSYTGQVTLPDAADYTIFVAIPGQNSEDQPIESATVRIKVLAPEDAPAGEALVAVEQPVPWALIGGVLVVAVAGGLIIRRLFADL